MFYGVQGNENNFLTQQDCDLTCRKMALIFIYDFFFEFLYIQLHRAPKVNLIRLVEQWLRVAGTLKSAQTNTFATVALTLRLLCVATLKVQISFI